MWLDLCLGKSSRFIDSANVKVVEEQKGQGRTCCPTLPVRAERVWMKCSKCFPSQTENSVRVPGAKFTARRSAKVLLKKTTSFACPGQKQELRQVRVCFVFTTPTAHGITLQVFAEMWLTA